MRFDIIMTQQRVCLSCDLAAGAVYSEVKRNGIRPPASHQAASHPHPGVSAAAAAAGRPVDDDDDDSDVGPELPPKLHVSQLVTADQQPPVTSLMPRFHYCVGFRNALHRNSAGRRFAV